MSQSLASLRFSKLALLVSIVFSYSVLASQIFAAPAQDQSPIAPVVKKSEPPGWWLKLTPEVLVLLSGQHLQATEVACNLPTLRVTHTESTAAGNYLFVWLKIGADTRSGTVVCRVITAAGDTSFEFPLSTRAPTLRKFQGLSQSDVLYLLMPDRFANGDPTNDEPESAPGSHDRSKPRAYHGGDLRGIRDHLPYFQELGVTTLWLTPILKNGATQDYHGYGAVDLYAVDQHLGTVGDYRELVASAHEMGIKVLFDAVLNHVGPNHPWVKNPPTPDWFHGTPAQHTDSSKGIDSAFYGNSAPPNGKKAATSGNGNHVNDQFESLVDPHAPTRLSKNITDGWFFNVLPDLNTENPLVDQYLLQNSIWWTETSGLDGFRLDTFPYIKRKFWANWHAALHRLYPNLTTIGEVFHPDPSVTSFFAGGQKRFDNIDTGVTTLFDFPLYFALREVLLRGAPAGKIPEVLRHDALYPHPDSLITFFANHDVARFAGADGSSLSQAATGLRFNSHTARHPRALLRRRTGNEWRQRPRQSPRLPRRLVRRREQRLQPARPHPRTTKAICLRAIAAAPARRPPGSFARAPLALGFRRFLLRIRTRIRRRKRRCSFQQFHRAAGINRATRRHARTKNRRRRPTLRGSSRQNRQRQLATHDAAAIAQYFSFGLNA